MQSMLAEEVYKPVQVSSDQLREISTIRVPGDFYRKVTLRDGLLTSITESNKLAFYKVSDTVEELSSFNMLSVLYDCLTFNESDDTALLVLSCKKVPVAVQ